MKQDIGWPRGVWLASSIALALACGPEAARAPAGTAPEPVGPPEAISLLGNPLERPALNGERREKLEAELAEARARLEQEPDSEDAIVWVGRRLAYLGRYREAIAEYTRGLELHPGSYKLLRHRGHRFVTVRDFASAVADLERAAELAADHADEVEPDGMPNRLGVPLSTVQFNIWYHLGLARYLQGDFEAALGAYRRCLEVSTNPDLLVATSDWLYMTLRRLGRDREAAGILEPITPELEVIENDSYLKRLRMYRGELQPEDLLQIDADAEGDSAIELATQGYGVGHWYLLEGHEERAREVFRRVVESSLANGSWAAFGAIAAESELSRLGSRAENRG